MVSDIEFIGTVQTTHPLSSSPNIHAAKSVAAFALCTGDLGGAFPAVVGMTLWYTGTVPHKILKYTHNSGQV